MAVDRKYGTLSLDAAKNRWVLTKLEPHVSLRFKSMFPRISKSRTGSFEINNDNAQCADLSWFMQRYPMEMSAADERLLIKGRKSFEQNIADMDRILLPDYVSPEYVGLKEGKKARDYQSQAVEVWKRRASMLLGDELGLGKTITTLLALLDPAFRPAVVVVKKHLVRQWRERIEEFTNLKVVEIKKTKPYDLPPADVYIFRYSQLMGWSDIFAKGLFKSVAYDEIQDLRTGVESEKGKAAQILSSQASYRMGMTASMIYNYGIELFNIVDGFIEPGILGSRDEFIREWCSPSDAKIVRDPDALGSFLREQKLLLRRTRSDVGMELQPVNPIMDVVDYDEKAVRSIEDLARKLAMKVTTGSFTERGQAGRELDLMVRQATGVAKAKPVADYVRILLESGTPIVLFGWHREVYNIWLRELAGFNPQMYTGTESEAAKDRSTKAFINGDSDLLIMSLRSGEGFDGLEKRCSTVVFGELDWSPEVHRQCIGRVDRGNQSERVMAIYLTSEGGSDPLMINVLGLKASQSRGIMDPNSPIQQVVSDQTRIKMLAEAYLKRNGIPELSQAA